MINLKRKKKTLKDIKYSIHVKEMDKIYINSLYGQVKRNIEKGVKWHG